MVELEITGLDFEGRGVGRIDGQVVFVAGALPDERVVVQLPKLEGKKPKRFIEAALVEVLQPSALRRTPPCVHYAECGGCNFQHIHDPEQIHLKTQIWRDQLARIGKTTPQTQLPAIEKALWHYRSRARLKFDARTGALGFMARGSNQVVNVAQCLILPEWVSNRLNAWRDLCVLGGGAIMGLEMSVGVRVVVVQITLRQMLPETWLSHAAAQLAAWAAEDGVAWQLVLVLGKTKRFVPADAPVLSYALPVYDLEIPFDADDFTQVNPPVNEAMVQRAIEALNAPQSALVLDAFCGLGNFSLALAKSGHRVLGVEGVQEMVDKATRLAKQLNLSDRCQFERADLFEPTKAQLKRFAQSDYWLLDPPRAGAQALVESIGTQGCKPKRMVYVSCDSGTFARDAGILGQKGYRLVSSQLLNMFPQTSHVESLNVFER